ncbi:hypothetical protein A2Z67_05310 [Candidatus Woesebacteria bacterium RBG_13_36_22]|uniref:PKD domain-containing protein n=1 Tax=Candidatus Woesebacteria bacterium RBG_13_36_22 TaxID=1802478 RepID=A0A1F7X6T8_9BACT|nr:MAG: hypothetical protein A2Z67_05310 [Candidatus Woesebacteria bacterium RBG_13_36_22]
MKVKLGAFLLFVLVFLLSPLFQKVTHAQAFTLSGHISDSTGTAIGGATLDVFNAGTTIDIVPPTISDNSGDYNFSVPGGNYDIKVTPPLGSNFSSALALSQTISSNTVLNFILTSAESNSLSGHVYDPFGNPLSGQQVYLDATNGTRTSTFTDSSGSYSLQVQSGVYDFNIYTSENTPSVNAPQYYHLTANHYSLTQSTIADITLPAKKVDVHVQDSSGIPVSGVEIDTSFGGGPSITLGGIAFEYTSKYGYSHPGPATDSSGNVTLWLFPVDSNHPYTFTATPPSGSIYSTITLNNIVVTTNQTELISLQFVHDPPVTTAILSPDPDTQGNYSDPTTVTLSAIATPGFSIESTNYSIDGGSQQIYTQSFTVGGDGSHTISYWSIDNMGVFESPKSKIFTIVSNRPPIIDTINDAIRNEGEMYSANGLFTDPTSISWLAIVDYGDGSGEQLLILSGMNFSLSHVYHDNGIYTVTIKITDNQGAIGTETAVVTVYNINPSIGIISVASNPLAVNTATLASASFSDPGVLDTHTASWDWGDGNIVTGTITELNGSGSVSDSHQYTVSGVYTVTLTVTDKDGGVGTNQYQYVVVYDPQGGYVTGAGTINSPIGAYTLDPTLSGLAHFGFNSKYEHGANIPTGKTRFRFQVAGLRFESTNYDWLVVAGAKAMYKGVGTINDSGNYGFMLSAIDGQINGGGGVDKFRIKIWDIDNNNALVYDNMLGADENSNPTTVVNEGSSIVIHQ